jgi:hypothetical protein
MNKTVVAVACLLVWMVPRVGWTERPANIAGTWEVTTRLHDKALNEQWTIEQKGAILTGTAKSGRGDRVVSGSIAGTLFRVTVQDGAKALKVRAMVDGDTMDGSVTYGAGEEYSWHARRASTR